MAERFRLSHAERNTDAWRNLKAYLEQRLADERKRGENLALDDRTRYTHAVRIDELKKFLALGDESAPDKLANAG